MQMIKIMKEIFHEENVPVWLHTYNILSTSKSRGLIELIPNSFSLDALKKKSNWPGTLNNFFIQYFCAEESDIDINTARTNYVSSMAGYSIVCYLLAIKDRHNGNIMIDNQGKQALYSILHHELNLYFINHIKRSYNTHRFRFCSGACSW